MLITATLVLSPPRAICALAAGVVFGAIAVIWGPAGQPAASLLLALALAWASAVDFERLLLPNVLTLGLVALGWASAAFRGPTELVWSVIGSAVGYGCLAAAALLYRMLRKRDGLGLGDAKLLAAAGAWVGWATLPVVLLVASFAGLAFVLVEATIRRRLDGSRPIPFGPFIAVGFWACWTFDLLDLLRDRLT